MKGQIVAGSPECISMGMRIRILRVTKGYSQARLAQLTDMAPNEISRVENNHVPGITAMRLSRIAAALGTTTSHLMGEVPFTFEMLTEKA